jgi:hypothetical protein
VLAVTGTGSLDLVHPESRRFTTAEAADAARSAAESGITRIALSRP